MSWSLVIANRKINLPNRTEIIQRQKDIGDKIAAVLPIYYPRELLRAFKIHPVEVWGPAKINTKSCDFHFQSYTCSIVRNATSFLLDQGLKDVDLLFFPHTCDSLQGMATVWKDFIRPNQKIITLYLPKGKRKSDEDFLITELKKIYHNLADFTGLSPADSEILDQIQIEEKIDEQISSFFTSRTDYEISDLEFYTIIRAREFLPPDIFTKLIASAPRGKNKSYPVRLFLSGIVPEPMELFDHMNKMGAQIVGDDLACCRRRNYAKISANDPFLWMAKRLLSAPPCPTKNDSIEDRVNYLTEKIKQVAAHGVIIYNPKFCEPELFDVPMIRKRLQEAKIPVLQIEVDLCEFLSQQTLNRIQAFLEILR